MCNMNNGMKKGLTIILFILMMTDYSSCQNISSDISILGGVSHYALNSVSNQIDEKSPGVSYLGGLYLNCRFSYVGSVGVGIRFEKNQLIEDRSKLDTYYFGFPVKINYYTGPAKRLFFGAGPYVGYLIYSRSRQFSHEGIVINSYTLNDVFSRFNLGLICSAGYSLPITNKFTIHAELEYVLGVLPINRKNNTRSTPPPDVKSNNRNICFGLSYCLN